jgi:hypothetical protein
MQLQTQRQRKSHPIVVATFLNLFRSDLPTLWNLGFGAVTSSSLIRWSNPIFDSHGLMKNVLLANSPQILLSVLCKVNLSI